MKYKKGSFTTIPNQKNLFGIDPQAQCLYMWLCFHANQEGECFPSRRLLSKESGMSIDSVKKFTAKLVKVGLIKKKMRKKGKENMTNLYEIDIKGVGVDNTQVGVDNTQVGVTAPEGVGADTTGELNPTYLTKTNKGVSPSETPIEEKKERILSPVEQIFDIFYQSVNPSINFGNKTQREAVEWLIKKYTLPGVIGMAKRVVSIQGLPYAPVVTTPYKMKEKLGELEIYFKKEKAKGKEVDQPNPIVEKMRVAIANCGKCKDGWIQGESGMKRCSCVEGMIRNLKNEPSRPKSSGFVPIKEVLAILKK